jgi:hypothetical protein
VGVGVTYMSHVKRGVIDDVSQPSSVAGDYSSREHMSLRVLCDRSQPSLSGDMCANEKFAELRVTVGTLFW